VLIYTKQREDILSSFQNSQFLICTFTYLFFIPFYILIFVSNLSYLTQRTLYYYLHVFLFLQLNKNTSAVHYVHTIVLIYYFLLFLRKCGLYSES